MKSIRVANLREWAFPAVSAAVFALGGCAGEPQGPSSLVPPANDAARVSESKRTRFRDTFTFQTARRMARLNCSYIARVCKTRLRCARSRRSSSTPASSSSTRRVLQRSFKRTRTASCSPPA
jgi:hypothetical protein